MGVSRNLRQFGLRMAVRASEVRSGAERVLKGAAFAGVFQAVNATPVKTGEARGGWFITRGTPSSATTGRLDVTGAATIREAEKEIARFKLPDGQLFLNNNVDHIEALDAGSSDQAPAGMTAGAIVASRAVVNRFRILDR